MFEIALASRSERGRRPDNEDAVACGACGSDRYAVLADGAGGHRHGAQASHRAVATIQAALQALPPEGASPEGLTQALQAAHEDLRHAQHGLADTDRMYSTVVALWIQGSRARVWWSHVGDSRLYRLRHGVVDVLTVDDSVVQRMLDHGLLSAEQSRNHPLKHQLVAALGVDDALDPHTLAEPADLEDGDAFLLCSDGWWAPLGDSAMALTLADAASPDDWLNAMKSHIEAQADPGQDNFSAIAVWVGDPGESTRFMDGDDWVGADAGSAA